MRTPKSLIARLFSSQSCCKASTSNDSSVFASISCPLISTVSSVPVIIGAKVECVISCALRSHANWYTSCFFSSSLGTLALVRINWTLSRLIPSLWRTLRTSSATSPPDEPLYIWASSMIKRSLLSAALSNHFFVRSQIDFSIGRMSIYSSIE